MLLSEPSPGPTGRRLAVRVVASDDDEGGAREWFADECLGPGFVLAGADGAEVEQLHEVGDVWHLREVAGQDRLAGGVAIFIVGVVRDAPAEAYAPAMRALRGRAVNRHR